MTSSLNCKIREQLKAYPEEQVERFVDGVHKLIERFRIFEQFPTEKTRLKSLHRLRTAIRTFDAILGRGQFVLPIPDNRMQQVWPGPDEKLSSELQGNYWKTKQTLQLSLHAFTQEIDRAITTAPVSRGRGRKRADAAGLVSSLRRLFRTCFSKRPSSTPGGPFSNITVEVITFVTGKRPMDVSRWLRRI